MTSDDVVATICQRLGEHAEDLAARLHRDREIDGYLAARRSFDAEMARHARTLVDLIGETEKVREHARTQDEWAALNARCAQLQGWLVEALDLFQAIWCPEHGHSPTPEQMARAAELRKLALS